MPSRRLCQGRIAAIAAPDGRAVGLLAWAGPESAASWQSGELVETVLPSGCVVPAPDRGGCLTHPDDRDRNRPFLPAGVLPGERPDQPVPRSQGADDPASSVRDDPPDLWERRVRPGEKWQVLLVVEEGSPGPQEGKEWESVYKYSQSFLFGHSPLC